jgi:hypothetical protein
MCHSTGKSAVYSSLSKHATEAIPKQLIHHYVESIVQMFTRRRDSGNGVQGNIFDDNGRGNRLSAQIFVLFSRSRCVNTVM